jgi:hypothetical protein
MEMDSYPPGTTISLIQVPENTDEFFRGWIIKSPGKKNIILGFLGEEITGCNMYKILFRPQRPIQNTKEQQDVMAETMAPYARKKIEGLLAGKLLRAAEDAIQKEPYINSIWVIKAGVEELEEWAINLANDHGVRRTPCRYEG